MAWAQGWVVYWDSLGWCGGCGGGGSGCGGMDGVPGSGKVTLSAAAER